MNKGLSTYALEKILEENGLTDQTAKKAIAEAIAKNNAKLEKEIPDIIANYLARELIKSGLRF